MRKKRFILPAFLFFIILNAASFNNNRMMEGSAHIMMHNRNQRGQWVAPQQASRLVNPLHDKSSSISQGKGIFQKFCVICHGDKAHGDGIGGISLNPRPANLLSSFVRNERDGALFWKITVGNAPMPSFKLILNETQRWEVVNYIRNLQRTYK